MNKTIFLLLLSFLWAPLTFAVEDKVLVEKFLDLDPYFENNNYIDYTVGDDGVPCSIDVSVLSKNKSLDNKLAVLFSVQQTYALERGGVCFSNPIVCKVVYIESEFRLDHKTLSCEI